MTTPATATSQPSAELAGYELNPTFPVERGSIGVGWQAIAERIVATGVTAVRLDGLVGVDWEAFRRQVDLALRDRGVTATWIDVAGAMKRHADIDAMVEPFLGGDDPIFGTRFTGELADFFDREKLAALEPGDAGLTIFYGCGAALVDRGGLLVYVDLPKDILQRRSRGGAVKNLGASTPIAPKPQYKRFYFVDWIALNRHKATLVDRVDLFIDAQQPDAPTVIVGEVMRDALDRMAGNVFRVRPWFEPGPWGGQWLKHRIPQLPQDVPNYAWSFELIVPENGLIVGDGRHPLEVSFDWLMYRNHAAVLGESAEWFGHEFPIRFDFLDTIDGGNLSLQCHPRPDFIREQFGEVFTQDETYYILDCENGAEVYLGFREGIDPVAFRAALETSARENVELDVRRFINAEPAHKHDLFLIPHGTVHCSGAGNMVLEISATPYIFTFKMYDWLRLDLEGNPRPMNIDRAFENLHFERQGDRATRELVSQPRVIDAGDDWRLVHLPTHAQHFYDVHRFEFDGVVEASTDGSPHVMMLVEGGSVVLETADMRQRFGYAETFVVPAAAGSYKLVNEGPTPAKVVKAFMKPRTAWPAWMHATA